MRIWEIDTLNQPFTRASYTETKFSKKVVSGKFSVLSMHPFCTSHSTCLNIGF